MDISHVNGGNYVLHIVRGGGREGGGRGGMEEFPCVGIVGGEVLVEVFRFVVV